MTAVTHEPATIKNVIFDLGGVLIDWNPRYLYRRLFTDESEMERFLAEVTHSHWNEQQDAGRPFAEAVAELIPAHPAYESHIRAYFDRWEEMLKGPIQGTVDLLEHLRREQQYRLFALSNWSAETFPIAMKKFPFLGFFERILVSGQEKLVKPNPKFYSLLILRFGIKPEESVFIDDVQKNIDAAQKLGFQTILFTSPAQLKSDLRTRFGIETD